MTARDRLFLGHVLDAIAAIESFTAEGGSYFMSQARSAKHGSSSRCRGAPNTQAHPARGSSRRSPGKVMMRMSASHRGRRRDSDGDGGQKV